MATLMHIKAIFQLSGLSERASIGLDFESAQTVITADVDNLLTAASDGWSSFMEQRFPASTNALLFSAYSYNIVAGKREIQYGPIERARASTGTGGGTATVPQVAVVVTHRTAISSRRTRGRVYLPSPRQSDIVADGSIQEAWRGQVESSYNNWVVGMQNSASFPNSLKHVVVSLKFNLTTEVVTRQVNNRVDTQRRRLPR
jgi:hypothetical protein